MKRKMWKFLNKQDLRQNNAADNFWGEKNWKAGLTCHDILPFNDIYRFFSFRGAAIAVVLSQWSSVILHVLFTNCTGYTKETWKGQVSIIKVMCRMRGRSKNSYSTISKIFYPLFTFKTIIMFTVNFGQWMRKGIEF